MNSRRSPSICHFLFHCWVIYFVLLHSLVMFWQWMFKEAHIYWAKLQSQTVQFSSPWKKKRFCTMCNVIIEHRGKSLLQAFSLSLTHLIRKPNASVTTNNCHRDCSIPNYCKVLFNFFNNLDCKSSLCRMWVHNFLKGSMCICVWERKRERERLVYSLKMQNEM